MRNCIEIDLDNRDEYVDEYDDERINSNLHDYIIERDINVKTKVVLNVKFNYEVSSDEKKILVSMLYRSFEEGLQSVYRDIKKLNLRDFFLFGLGVLFLVIYWWLSWYEIAILSEIFLVMSWVAFWEVAEGILFLRPEYIIKKRKYRCLLKADIKFR